MKCIVFCLSFFCFSLHAQLYFPPTTTDEWATMDPNELGWCDEKIDSLLAYLDVNKTKAFIVLKDGKIVVEEYFNGHDAETNWYWASAGKSLMSFMVGKAQEEGFLEIEDTSSDYLGEGWTNMEPDLEKNIKIWNQLTMTTGLDDGLDPFCTEPECLEYLEDPGNRWAYHNAPYTLLASVLEEATDRNINTYVFQKLTANTGITGAYVDVDFNKVFFSTPRVMARYGLLMLSEGSWNGTSILEDEVYFDAMINPSQDLNKSYGYLWWLNGQESYMLPGSQFVFPGKSIPAAPDDTYAALGKDGQIINVVPSENLVWIRMGENASGGLVSLELTRGVWDYLTDMECISSNSSQKESPFRVFPNPVNDRLYLEMDVSILQESLQFALLDPMGRSIRSGQFDGNFIDISGVPSGCYILQIHSEAEFFTEWVVRQ